jgi:CheY-like chemotaxis protein
MSRVLIVEDEPTNMVILAAYMRKAGHQVDQASDGVEALERLERDPAYDVVVTDRRMPRMDGLELFRRAMADPRLRGIPFIMQTAATAPNEVVEGIQAGVYYYLTKPYHEESLITLVGSAAKQTAQAELFEDGRNRQRDFLTHTFMRGDFKVRTLEDCENVAILIGNVFPDPESAAGGLYELTLNAIEHGMAGIGYENKAKLLAESRWEQELAQRLRDPTKSAQFVNVRFQRDDQKLEVAIKDPGAGFNWSEFLQIDPSRATRANGRGIAKANLLSFDTLKFNAQGNEVTVSVAAPDRVA